MHRQEAVQQYAEALKSGQKAYKASIAAGEYPYLQVLDEILDDALVAGRVHLGLLEIPADQIVGTKSAGRKDAFAPNFMPLLSERSEFAAKWIALCEAHLSPEGIREPIRCFEYLGRFYVQEGNKRVSVLKSYGAETIPGYVIRLLPTQSREEMIVGYEAFLQAFECTGLYQVAFTRPGSFAKLQAALGHAPDYVWSEEDRRHFLSGYSYFKRVFLKLGGGELSCTVADAMLVWLELYPYEQLKITSLSELEKGLQAVWKDVKNLNRQEPIAVHTRPDKTEQGILGRLKSGLFHTHVHVAVINEYAPENSLWIQGHVLGAEHLQQAMGGKVTVRVYNAVGCGEQAEAVMEQAVARGAQVLFVTTATLMDVCRKIAARHPHVRVLNCSVSMPYTGVRTYYSRIYEGMFIAGAIAGAMTKTDRIGYVAGYPIFGVPAAINAFALGAGLTNPRARVQLLWACTPGNPVKTLAEQGVEYISTLDIPTSGTLQSKRGLCRVDARGNGEILAAPYWDWGEFYTRIVGEIINGSWDNMGKHTGQAVNYWWGMSGGVIGMQYAEDLPEGVRTLAQLLQQGLTDGSLKVFHREIRDQVGNLRSDGQSWLSMEEILSMDWLCDTVDGSFPAFEELLPQAQPLVRIQGIYRDTIPPEKEGVLF